jgi:CheY-like chemotaxis protein
MRKILVIEDDTLLCWLLKKIIGVNADVVIMNDGMDAWQWLSNGNFPDLIISDLKMPSLDGIQLLQNLNGASSTLKDIPVIMLSGYEDPVKRKTCMDLGAYAYMVKPFEPPVLIEMVDQVLSGRVQLQA